MTNMLILLALLITTIFIQMNHPLAMGLILLIQTLLMCLIIGFMNETYWFSYILFLIFMGGMLVLFMYVTSLASNEMFSLSSNILWYLFIIMSFSFLFYTYDNSILNDFFNMTIKNIYNENFMNLIKLFNFPTNLITILLMNYLLITLIAVVNHNIWFALKKY